MDLSRFLNDLAAPTGAPGGGAASAVAGAMGCALLEMVAGVTLSLPRFTEGRDRLEEIRVAASSFGEKLKVLSEKDTQAYLKVEAAMKMPRSTQEEKNLRREAMQQAFIGATEVPLEVLETAVSAMGLIPDLLKYGNPNAVTDVAVGALLLETAVRGAAMNAEINIASIKDEAFAARSREKISTARQTAASLLEQVEKAVKEAGLTF